MGLNELERKLEEHENRISALEKLFSTNSPTKVQTLKKSPNQLLSSEDIATLKQKMESLGNVKGNRAALEIVAYLEREKKIENFELDDLGKCYSLLKKAGVKNIPPISNMAQLVRDICNNNGWFMKNTNGTYSISNLGYHILSQGVTS